MPSAHYNKDDLEDETALCGIDFYSPDLALCPKIWSTSAAIVMYDISEGRFKGNRLGFQTEVCAGGKVAKFVAKGAIGRLKFSINQETTSATFTPSSLLYYHFSRYFEFTTTVPVAVWRSIDKSVLLNEVALGGQSLSAGQDLLEMNHSAWTTLVEAIQRPETYQKPGSYGSAADFLTADGSAAYGTIYDGGGTQYGPEMNGSFDPSRDGIPFGPPAFGDSQDNLAERRYTSFLQTPVVLALNSDLPLADAITEGLRTGGNKFTPEGYEPQNISPVQMAFWMGEMAEILMIDTIMAQQDRPGNIDYKEYFYWQEAGQIKSKRVRDQLPGEGDIPLDAQILRRTRLNDNDAGGRTEYDNHLAQMMAIEKLRHFNRDVYGRLQDMNADFQTQGPMYQWLKHSIGLTERQTEMIVENTAHVAQALKANLDSGQLRLDLEPEVFFLSNTAD